MLFLLSDLSFITLFTITSRVLLLIFLSTRDRGFLLDFLEEDFQDHGWCIFLGIVWGFKSESTKCWNLLESTPARIPLIKSSHKWTRMLFIISNSKLGIWICSQPKIDLNSQSNVYDVLTRPYKYLSNTLSTLSTKQHALNTIYMLVSPGYETFTLFFKQIPFPLHPSLTRSRCHNNT